MQSDPAHHLASGSGHNSHGSSSGRATDAHEPHGATHHSDNSPFPPASPNLSTAFHRPHQTGNDNDVASMPSLRRRITQPSTAGDVLRIAIATPFSDMDRRKERDMSTGTTVAQLKDRIAHDEDEQWERNGMRLVWQGRIVRDDEVLGDIVGKREAPQVHTFHLVARRLGAPSRPALSRTATLPTLAPPAPSSAFHATPDIPAALPVTLSRNTQALSDTVHLVLFLIRHHLCHLLNVEPLAWDDVYPRPVIDQQMAKEAVMSVVQAFAAQRADRDEAWERWEKSFEDVELITWDGGARNNVEDEIKSIWSERLGRHWKDGHSGEDVAVEFDGHTQQLHLPPLDLMAPRQLLHLLLYLRLTSLLPLLNHLLVTSSIPTPTPTLAAPAPSAVAPRVRVRMYGIRMRLNADTLWNVLFGAIKVGAMLWMLTRDMKWSDIKLWIIGGGLLGWWLGDALNQLRPNVLWNNGRPIQPNGPNAGVNGAAPAGGVAPGAPANNDAPGAGADTHPPRQPPQTGTLVTRMIPLIHLDADSEQLLLARRRPLSQPFRLVTQMMLPVALWFITLIPEWEALRARAIRRRERAMRVWVGELTDAERPAAQNEGTVAGDVNPDEREDAPALPPVLPAGLGLRAKKYYERVVARGEGIDWEEEREAQRAMGVADEDEGAGAGDGMRMRML